MGPGPGQYTLLGATGPGADLFWTETGTWVSDQSQAFVFGSVQAAQRTPILGLPTGYRPVLIPTTVVITAPPATGYSPC